MLRADGFWELVSCSKNDRGPSEVRRVKKTNDMIITIRVLYRDDQSQNSPRRVSSELVSVPGQWHGGSVAAADTIGQGINTTARVRVTV